MKSTLRKSGHRASQNRIRCAGLPHQEAGEPLLPGGPDDQVRIGLALGVEVLGDVFDVEGLGHSAIVVPFLACSASSERTASRSSCRPP